MFSNFLKFKQTKIFYQSKKYENLGQRDRGTAPVFHFGYNLYTGPVVVWRLKKKTFLLKYIFSL